MTNKRNRIRSRHGSNGQDIESQNYSSDSFDFLSPIGLDEAWFPGASRDFWGLCFA